MEEKKQKGNIGVALLVVLLVGAAFMVGRLSLQVDQLKKGTADTSVTGSPSPAVAGEQATPLSAENLKVYAKDLGLNAGDFNKCLDEGKYAAKLKADEAYGQTLGVSGTPTFFVNEVMVVGAYPQELFEAIIDFELAGGDWSKPTAEVKDLVDKNEQNGEVTLGNEVETGKGYVRGGENAKVKIIVFDDFECPYCARVFSTTKALEAKYEDSISFEFRHFPLPFHANAQKAGEAAECAGEQGKFWEMHDKLYFLQENG